MHAITIDQLRVFRRVAETGSFSAAARSLHRAQSAITYAVQKLEDQVGAQLFDRSAYRPVLSEAGRALLPRAVRILEELSAFGAQASAIAGGLEPEVALVVDSIYSTPSLVAVLQDFRAEFPAVSVKIMVESLGATAQCVLEGGADLGVTLDFAAAIADLDTTPMGEVELVPVAAPGHPLAAIRGRIEPERFRDELQLVLTDRSRLTEGKQYSVFATRTWRLADLGARHEMLLAGLGWGSMPIHMVDDDLAAGRLVKLDIRRPDGMAKLPRPGVVLARRRDKVLGPAGAWLAKRLLLGGALPEKKATAKRRAKESGAAPTKARPRPASRKR
ncbi:MAG TPA: LysR family transcriptional regulator [Usitatibacter sp.]|nr:LysR family transcriptional regulator [Usitatibacter sp.]